VNCQARTFKHPDLQKFAKRGNDLYADESNDEGKPAAAVVTSDVDSDEIQNDSDEGPDYDDDQSINAGAEYDKLLKDLFGEDYNSEARPGNVSVSIGLGLLCAQLDSKSHVLTSRVWLREFWTDPRLTWDESDYGGLDSISVRSWYIWRPDIKLYNSWEEDYPDWNVNVIVHSSGTVFWVPPVTFKSLCSSSGDCKLELGSWTHDGFSISLDKLHNLDLDYYDTNCPFEVTNAKTELKVQKYECCEEPYPSFVTEFTVKQK